MMMMVPMMVDPTQNFGASATAGGAMMPMMMPQMGMSPGAPMGMMPQQQPQVQQMLMPVYPVAVAQGGQQHAVASSDGSNPMAAVAQPQQQQVVMNPMATMNPLDMAHLQQQVPQYGGSQQLQGGGAAVGSGDSSADSPMGDAQQQQGGAVLPTADQQQQQQQQQHQPVAGARFAVPHQPAMQQQQYYQAPPTFAMYPQMSGGFPTVQLGLHPHHGHAGQQQVGVSQPAAPGNPAGGMHAVPGGGMAATMAPPAGVAGQPPQQQQQQQLQAGTGKRSSPQPAPGGGGNLAHCA